MIRAASLLTLCLAFAGCARYTVNLVVCHKGSNEPVASAAAILQRHDESMFNSKMMWEESPVPADAQGRITVLGVRDRDTIMVEASGFTSALVGIRNRHTLSLCAPLPESGDPFPASVFTNISATLIVPLEPRKAP